MAYAWSVIGVTFCQYKYEHYHIIFLQLNSACSVLALVTGQPDHSYPGCMPVHAAAMLECILRCDLDTLWSRNSGRLCILEFSDPNFSQMSDCEH